MGRFSKGRRGFLSAQMIEGLETRRMLVAIASGQTFNAAISALGEFDDYTFDATIGNAIIAGISRNASGIEPRLRIIAPDNSVVHDEANTFGFDHTITATQTGTYTFRVSDFTDDETGGYSVSMVKAPGPQTSDGDDGPLTSGQSYDGTFTLGDLDVYPFTAVAGESITMGLSRVNSGVDARLDVYSSSATLVHTDSTTFGLAADFTAPQTGTYYAVVYDVGCDEAGAYRVSFARPSTPTLATPLGSGQHVRGAIGAGQFRLFTFNVPQAGADVRLGASRDNSAIEPRVNVFGPTGAPVANGISSFGFDLDFEAVTAGTYVAVVGDGSADEAGDFGLSVAVGGATPALDRGPLVSGRQVRSGLELGMLQTYTFSGIAGQNVVFGMSRNGSAIEPRLDIFAPNGTLVDNNISSFGFDLEVTLPTTGVYLAVAADATADEGGAFNLSFARSTGAQQTGAPPSDVEGGVIFSGERRSGWVDVGDLDVYTFEADLGDNILVGMSRVNSAVEPRLNLYAPSGALLGTNVGSFGTSVEAVAPATGVYTIIVRDNLTDEAGGYGVSLAIGPHPITADPLDPDGGALTSGVTRSGSFTLADSDIYSFDATMGSPFTVRMIRQNGSALEPTLIVYAPNGARFFNASATEANVTVASAPITGTYLVVASDAAFDEAGGYALALGGATPTAADTRAPTALAGFLEFVRSGNVQIQFSEAMTGLVATNLALNNLTSGAQFVATGVTFDAATALATYTVAGGPPDGNYNASLSVGTARDLANNALAAGINFSFFVFRGDANRDRTIDVADFALLAGNFNAGGTFLEGDFDYTGLVDIADFAVLASKFNTSLPAPSAVPGDSPRASAIRPTATDSAFSRRPIEIDEESALKDILG